MKTPQEAIGDIGLAAHLLSKCGGVLAMSVHLCGAVRVRVHLTPEQFRAMFPKPVGTVVTGSLGSKWLSQTTGQVEYFCLHEEVEVEA